MKDFTLVLKILGVCLAFNSAAFAEQPRQSKAQEAFLTSECKLKASEALGKQGFVAQDTATSLVAGDWTDEGVQGAYISTTYFQKGENPWERASATVAAVIWIANGHIVSVTCFDPKKGVEALVKAAKANR